jgi:hypothetical protein
MIISLKTIYMFINFGPLLWVLITIFLSVLIFQKNNLDQLRKYHAQKAIVIN